MLGTDSCLDGRPVTSFIQREGVKIWGGGEALTVGVPRAALITTGYISAIPSCSPAHSLKHTSLAFSVFC